MGFCGQCLYKTPAQGLGAEMELEQYFCSLPYDKSECLRHHLIGLVTVQANLGKKNLGTL